MYLGTLLIARYILTPNFHADLNFLKDASLSIYEQERRGTCGTCVPLGADIWHGHQRSTN